MKFQAGLNIEAKLYPCTNFLIDVPEWSLEGMNQVDVKLERKNAMSNYLNYEYAIIIGEDEINNNTCTIKNLSKNSQETVSFEQIIETLN